MNLVYMVTLSSAEIMYFTRSDYDRIFYSDDKGKAGRGRHPVPTVK